ncbi:mitochondrial import inner membrane translocase subunit TIM13 [Nematocida homosporus]|uniref:mitochondrial import inner membrane translocase subunit TIM13 n=1 Tax=Nematocida homosporus TaxID=1912981 RepID=UPI00221E4C5A|nr:mitochondrial import inner membrane translocase subunit TIM13 [Nematocida homosporus]KAI5185940.1 mitochondrial import inner membrane translocase subunit TIM13 [Nematocida homosporus]
MNWIQRRPGDPEVTAFFEETTEECFNKCVSTIAHPLNKKEKKCIEQCTLIRLERLRDIEQAIASHIQKKNK